MNNTLRFGSAALAAILAAGTGLFGARPANADTGVDFANPATALSGAAVIASGTCIAKYAAALDDRISPAAQIGQRVAERCAKEISKSAGLASWMIGKPDEYPKYLKYNREELTTNTVLRARAATKQHSI